MKRVASSPLVKKERALDLCSVQHGHISSCKSLSKREQERVHSLSAMQKRSAGATKSSSRIHGAVIVRYCAKRRRRVSDPRVAFWLTPLQTGAARGSARRLPRTGSVSQATRRCLLWRPSRTPTCLRFRWSRERDRDRDRTRNRARGHEKKKHRERQLPRRLG